MADKKCKVCKTNTVTGDYAVCKSCYLKEKNKENLDHLKRIKASDDEPVIIRKLASQELDRIRGAAAREDWKKKKGFGRGNKRG